MGYRLAIFDFDGTLADSLPWFEGILDRVADEFAIRKIDPEARINGELATNLYDLVFSEGVFGS